MARKPRFPTLWEVPDQLWELISPILEKHEPRKPTGRRRVDRRRVLDGIIFRLRTGCQWNHIPSVYGDDSTLHRYFRHWAEQGVFREVWALIVGECQELGRVNWEWQSADGAMGKARMGGMV